MIMKAKDLKYPVAGMELIRVHLTKNLAAVYWANILISTHRKRLFLQEDMRRKVAGSNLRSGKKKNSREIFVSVLDHLYEINYGH